MYNNFIKFKEFKDSFQISSYRLIDSSCTFSESSYTSDPDNILRISRSRSFSLLRDYIKSNHFDYFVTLTLKDPLSYSISEAIKLFTDSIALYSKYSNRYYRKVYLKPRIFNESELLEDPKMMRHFSGSSYNSEFFEKIYDEATFHSQFSKKTSSVATTAMAESSPSLSSSFPGFKYIYVFELTKAGGVHVHGFFSGFYDLYVNQYGYTSSLFFDRLGFQNFIKAEQVNEFYLMKYITKQSIPGLKRRFFRSRNLEKPIITKFLDRWDNFLDLNWSYRNEYSNMTTISNT